jgi:hypothetical protein
LDNKRTLTTLTFAALLLSAGPLLAAVTVQEAGGTLTWQIDSTHGGAVLTVRGPEGLVRREFPSNVDPSLRVATASGAYAWQLTVKPALSEADKAALAEARAQGTEPIGLPSGFTSSGVFSVVGLAVVVPVEAAPPTTSIGDTDLPRRDQVIADDLIVQGSICAGFDCVNNESFGFDTIRLKENNLRIKFEDTSTGAGFPSTDWQLTANDSASGGANKFSIEDITGSKVPLTITAGAPTNSVFVDSSGRVGLRTSTPVLDLHIATGNTPALRLEQNGSGGFTPQTWDVAGNEANFFVRDVTSGSRLPFRIFPGAVSSSLVITGSSNIGIGTPSPSTSVHITRSSNTANLLVEDTTATTGGLEMLTLKKSAGVPFMQYNSSFGDWDFSGGNFFVINDPADAAIEMQLERDGKLTLSGSANATAFNIVSDVNKKENFLPVDAQAILRQVNALPLSTWNFKADAAGIRYLGPMAQDFFKAFQLGENATSIATTNLDGVALAAIQGLSQQLAQKDAQLTTQGAELADLKARLAALEAKLSDR